MFIIIMYSEKKIKEFFELKSKKNKGSFGDPLEAYKSYNLFLISSKRFIILSNFSLSEKVGSSVGNPDSL